MDQSIGRIEQFVGAGEGVDTRVLGGVAGLVSACERAGWSADDLCRVMDALSSGFPLRRSSGLAELEVVTESVEDGGRVAGDVCSAGVGAVPQHVDFCGSVGGVKEVVGVERDGTVRGKRYAENKRRKERKKKLKTDGRGLSDGGVPEWRKNSVPVGFCETVVSQQSCPSYSQALSDAEREAKESLARRRAAENAVAEKLAKMKLESLEDEQKCHEYAELKRQRVIQWTNEATAKSQQSLEKCKSIDPSSSASQYEIRKQAKALADLREEHSVLLKVFSERVPDHRKILDMLKPVSSESMERYALEGMDAAVSVPDYADSMYDVHLTH